MGRSPDEMRMPNMQYMMKITVMKESLSPRSHMLLSMSMNLCVCRHRRRSQRSQFCGHYKSEFFPYETIELLNLLSETPFS